MLIRIKLFKRKYLLLKLFFREISAFNPGKLISVSVDQSWGLWDLESRKLDRKIKLEEEVISFCFIFLGEFDFEFERQ